MPNFSRMYTNLRGDSDASGNWIITLAHWVNEYQVLTLSVVFLSVLGFGIWIFRGSARRHLIALGLQIPWVRTRVEDFQLAMLYQALALMLKGGHPMSDALQIASQSALDTQLIPALRHALQRIEEGGAVAQALADEGLCDEVGRRLMAAAERNGDFHLAADVVSRLYRERFELFVERLTRIVEPVLLTVVALMVGGIVVMMYLPVFEMTAKLR